MQGERGPVGPQGPKGADVDYTPILLGRSRQGDALRTDYNSYCVKVGKMGFVCIDATLSAPYTNISEADAMLIGFDISPAREVKLNYVSNNGVTGYVVLDTKGSVRLRDATGNGIKACIPFYCN